MKVYVKIVDEFIVDMVSNHIMKIEGLDSDRGKGINIVTDMDNINLKKDTVVEYVNEFNNKTIKIIKGEEAVKSEIEKLFVKQKEIKGYSISYIHNEPDEKMLLRKLGVEENYKIADKYLVDNGVPLNTFVLLGDKKIYLINDEIVENLNKKILSSTQYEKWIGVFNMFYPNDKVKEKIKFLQYKENKEEVDSKLKEYINKYKAALNKYVENPLHILSLPEDEIAEHSPYYNEYMAIRENVIEIEHMGFYIYVDKRDKVWNIEVPDRLKGLFIGKGGKNIKKLREEHKIKRINVI